MRTLTLSFRPKPEGRRAGTQGRRGKCPRYSPLGSGSPLRSARNDNSGEFGDDTHRKDGSGSYLSSHPSAFAHLKSDVADDASFSVS